MRKVDDKEVENTKVQSETVYTYAEVEQIKAEYEEKLKAKDAEIEMIKENASKIAEIRAELGEYVKDFSDEDILDNVKVENARLKKELDELKKDKTEITKASEEKLETGHDKVEDVENTDDKISTFLSNRYSKLTKKENK